MMYVQHLRQAVRRSSVFDLTPHVVYTTAQLWGVDAVSVNGSSVDVHYHTSHRKLLLKCYTQPLVGTYILQSTHPSQLLYTANCGHHLLHNTKANRANVPQLSPGS